MYLTCIFSVCGVCVCVRIWMGVPVNVEVRVWVSSSVTLYFLRQHFSLSPEFINSLVQMASELQASSHLCLPVLGLQTQITHTHSLLFSEDELMSPCLSSQHFPDWANSQVYVFFHQRKLLNSQLFSSSYLGAVTWLMTLKILLFLWREKINTDLEKTNKLTATLPASMLTALVFTKSNQDCSVL